MSIGVSFNIEMDLDIEDLLTEEAEAMFKLVTSHEYRKLATTEGQIDLIENRITPETCFEVLHWFIDGLHFPNCTKSSMYTYTFEVEQYSDFAYRKRRLSKISTVNEFVLVAFSTYTGEKYIIDTSVHSHPNRYRPWDEELALLKYFLEYRTEHKLKCSIIEVPSSTKRWESSYPVFNIKRGYVRA